MNRLRAPSRRLPRRHGFSLIELTVVVLVLVLLASMIVPRLFTNTHRLFEATGNQVADLMTMFAQRDRSAQQLVGLFYDEDLRQIMVMVYDAADEQVGRDAGWRTDRFMQPVRLPEFVELLEVREDQFPIDIHRWPLATPPGQQRPWIEVVLGGPDGATMTISLAPHEVSPIVYNHEDDPPMVASPIDLNATGRMRDRW